MSTNVIGNREKGGNVHIRKGNHLFLKLDFATQKKADCHQSCLSIHLYPDGTGSLVYDRTFHKSLTIHILTLLKFWILPSQEKEEGSGETRSLTWLTLLLLCIASILLLGLHNHVRHYCVSYKVTGIS